MKINVTQEHIDNGTRLASRCCLVALAMKDAGIGDPAVYHEGGIVFGFGVFTYSDRVSKRVRFDLPPEARMFVKIYDDQGLFVPKPFEFELEV